MKVLMISKLTPLGLQTFEDHVAMWPNHPLPEDFFSSSIYSKSLYTEFEIDPEKTFIDRLEVAKYLKSVLGEKLLRQNYDNYNLWNWISAVYFTQLHPSNKVSLPHHYIYDTSLSYRHCIAMPIRLLLEYGADFARLVVGRKIEEMGDGIEQIASKQYLLRSDKFRSLLLDLYKDTSTGLIKSGVTGDYEKKLKRLRSGKISVRGQGGVRRLGLEIKRLSLTKKLDDMHSSSIKDILSPEFQKYYPT